MKKNELIKIIELVVRKEVKKQVNEIFIKENKKVQQPSLTNETAGGVPQGEGGYDTMGNGTYDTSRMGELLGYGDMSGDKETKRKVAAVDSIKKAGVNVEQVPDHVQNALTKDYSKVMKAIDQKKAGGYRP